MQQLPVPVFPATSLYLVPCGNWLSTARRSSKLSGMYQSPSAVFCFPIACLAWPLLDPHFPTHGWRVFGHILPISSMSGIWNKYFWLYNWFGGVSLQRENCISLSLYSLKKGGRRGPWKVMGLKKTDRGLVKQGKTKR